MNQEESRLPSQTVFTVLVLSLDIKYAAVAKTIIDTEIHDKYFDFFFEQVLEVCKNITKKRSPFTFATEIPLPNYPNQEQHQDDAEQDFDSDNGDIVETTVHKIRMMYWQ